MQKTTESSGSTTTVSQGEYLSRNTGSAVSQPIICDGCTRPINPLTGECGCS